MWAVEARNYGEQKDYFYMSGLTQKEARRRHAQMSNSGKWAMVRSWDLGAEFEQQESNRRIEEYFKQLEDGVGEGQIA